LNEFVTPLSDALREELAEANRLLVAALAKIAELEVTLLLLGYG
jgi:hypothetical protein